MSICVGADLSALTGLFGISLNVFNTSDSQNDLKHLHAVIALLMSLWAFSWSSGTAAQRLQKHVFCARLCF